MCFHSIYFWKGALVYQGDGGSKTQHTLCKNSSCYKKVYKKGMLLDWNITFTQYESASTQYESASTQYESASTQYESASTQYESASTQYESASTQY